MKSNQSELQILRRIGPAPHAGGHQTVSPERLSRFFEGNDKNFYLIGVDRTEELRGQLPSDASCSPDERIIEVSRRTIVLAKSQIPDTL